MTGLVIDDAQRWTGHFGAQYAGNLLWERFHIEGHGRTIKHYITTMCMSCRNCKAAPRWQQMAPLSLERVTPRHQPFHSCGLDFMGPISVRVGKRTTAKRYVCLFTCLATHATHFEVAYYLTTGSFISALRRFLAVCGNATKVIFSDSATNFLGVEAQLQQGTQRLSQQGVIGELAVRGIAWKHSLPWPLSKVEVLSR